MTPRRTPKTLLAVFVVAAMVTGCGGAGNPGSENAATLTVYSASGLGAWYTSQFDRFTRDTGIKVNLFEAGSGEVVSRLNSGAVWNRLNNDQSSIPPADLIVTLPPFIQKADKAGLLQPSGADTTGIPAELVGPAGSYVPILNTALCFIANPAADPKPVTWQDLLASRFKGKLQYSTPGEAGDGTALLLLLQHLMGKQGALDYLAKLQPNNVGPAKSTASLQPKVSSGELLIANGDVQMNLASIKNEGARFTIFFPAMPDNSRTTVALPYVAGVAAATQRPEEAKKLLALLLSDEAQKQAATQAFGMPVRKSVADQTRARDGADGPGGVLRGVTLWAPDWNVVLDELETDLVAYQEAVG
jgi:2-aminoethylphosphonate transport system substrate-binding protein